MTLPSCLIILFCGYFTGTKEKQWSKKSVIAAVSMQAHYQGLAPRLGLVLVLAYNLKD